MSHVEVYNDPSTTKAGPDEKGADDSLSDVEQSPAETYIYVPNTPEEAALVRKIDWRMLPILWLMYVLNYMDRTNIGNARVGGMGVDLSITSTQYSVIVAAFFVTYIVFENPAAMILTRTRPSWFFPGIMFTWGGLTLAFLGVQKYDHIVALRVLLGVIEAGFYPGVNYYLTEWFPPRELARRIAIFYSASILSSAFSGVLAGIVIESLDGTGGIRGWRWLFLIEGVVTMGVAAAAVFILPDWPLTSKFLTPAERRLAHARVAAHAPKLKGGKTGHWAAFMMAVSDPKVWVIAFFYHAIATIGSLAYFAPTLTKEMGYTGRNIQFMIAPFYAAGTVVSLIVAWSSDRHKDRAFHMAGCAFVAGIGFLIPLLTLNNTARYIALTMGVCGLVSAVPLWPSYLISLIANDPLEKRAGAIAFVSGFASIGALIGSFVWPQKDAPRFALGFGYSLALSIFMFVLILTFHIVWGRPLLRRMEAEKSKEVGGQVQGPVAIKI